MYGLSDQPNPMPFTAFSAERHGSSRYSTPICESYELVFVFASPRSGGDVERVPPRVVREEAAAGVLRSEPGDLDALAHARDVVRGRQDDRPALHADRAGRNGVAAAPDVEAEVVVIPARRDERRAAEVRLLLEADHVAIEAETLVDVADMQVEVPHPEAGADALRHVVALDAAEQVRDV